MKGERVSSSAHGTRRRKGDLLFARVAGGEIRKERGKPTQGKPLVQGVGCAGSGGGWLLAGWSACPKLAGRSL